MGNKDGDNTKKWTRLRRCLCYFITVIVIPLTIGIAVEVAARVL